MVNNRDHRQTTVDTISQVRRWDINSSLMANRATRIKAFPSKATLPNKDTIPRRASIETIDGTVRYAPPSLENEQLYWTKDSQKTQGFLEACLAGLACCCCLDLLF